MRFLLTFLGLERFASIRRLLGGHWERWYVDHPVCAEVWHHVPACTTRTGARPSGLCRGTPTCESW